MELHPSMECTRGIFRAELTNVQIVNASIDMILKRIKLADDIA